MKINKLKEHLENTPLNELQKEWAEVIEWAKVEPKAIDLVKLFAIPDVVVALKCDCKHSGSCKYEQVILETKEICRHKE